MRTTRSEALEFALLGLLDQGALHGYELRKRLIAIYGPFRALSFSVLYPQLRRMLEAGIIEESEVELVGRASKSKRSRIVYALTPKGQARFDEMTQSAGPDSWDDESFEVRFAFFGPTPQKNRVAILEGRLRRLSEKAAILRNELEKAPAGIDKYLSEWRRHSLESSEREIVWLEEMLNTERKSS
jgi:DNA-binding PadR family transcriptional regulator